MKKFLSLIAYVFPYKQYAFLNIFFNLLSAVFALFTFSLAMPFLGILFGTHEMVTEPIDFELSTKYFTHSFYYQISKVIVIYGKNTALLIVCLMVVSASLLKNSCRFLANYFMAHLRSNTMKDIRNKIYNKILELPLSYYTESRKGDIITRISNDVIEIESSIMSSLEMIFREPITIVIFIGFMFATSTKLTFFAIFLLPLSALIIGRIARLLRSISQKAQKRLGIITSFVDETLTGLRVIKSFNAEEKMYRDFKNTNQYYSDLTCKIQRRRYLANPLSEFMGTIVMMILMWFGGTLVLGNNSGIKPETFITYMVIFSQVIVPAKALGTEYFNIQRGMASYDRVNELLNADLKISEKPDAKSIKDFKESIEFKNVCFTYSIEPVLNNINCEIKKGKTIAIVGRSGSGKSTLVDLLPRFIDTQSGDVFIDGISVKDYKIKDLRNLMGIVSQQSILFNDTFYNNIAFGVENATPEAVIAAAKVANAHQFISETPDGYNTNIGEGGSKLSGGQKQRISIARAVLKNPPILILDEATSALDTESERLVQDAIINLMKNRTSVVIAHRLSTIKHSDEIIVIDDGKIIEKGTHDNLIAANGIYNKLHVMQMF